MQQERSKIKVLLPSEVWGETERENAAFVLVYSGRTVPVIYPVFSAERFSIHKVVVVFIFCCCSDGILQESTPSIYRI